MRNAGLCVLMAVLLITSGCSSSNKNAANEIDGKSLSKRELIASKFTHAANTVQTKTENTFQMVMRNFERFAEKHSGNSKKKEDPSVSKL